MAAGTADIELQGSEWPWDSDTWLILAAVFVPSAKEIGFPFKNKNKKQPTIFKNNFPNIYSEDFTLSIYKQCSPKDEQR